MLTFRYNLFPEDPEIIRDIASSTGFFDDNDICLTVALAEDIVAHQKPFGEQNHKFLLLEDDGKAIAYACFGLIPTTEANYELEWLAVHSDCRGRGLGTMLLNRVVEVVRTLGGRKLYIKTEGTKQYLPTRRFYHSCGFEEEAVLKEYYADNDDCYIFAKSLRDVMPHERLSAE